MIVGSCHKWRYVSSIKQESNKFGQRCLKVQNYFSIDWFLTAISRYRRLLFQNTPENVKNVSFFSSFILQSNGWIILVKQMLTEVVFHRRKLRCRPWTEVVSHATLPYLVKVKINFDEAQKLTWKEIKCL